MHESYKLLTVYELDFARRLDRLSVICYLRRLGREPIDGVAP